MAETRVKRQAPTARDREVHRVAEVAVEDGLGGLAPGALGGEGAATGLGEGPDHAEGREVNPDRLEAGAADGLDQGGDHVAPGGDDDDVDLRRRIGLRGRAAHDLVLENRLVDRHRNLLLRLEADRGLHLLRILDRR